MDLNKALDLIDKIFQLSISGDAMAQMVESVLQSYKNWAERQPH